MLINLSHFGTGRVQLGQGAGLRTMPPRGVAKRMPKKCLDLDNVVAHGSMLMAMWDKDNTKENQPASQLSHQQQPTTTNSKQQLGASS